MKEKGKYLLALNAHPKIGAQTIKKILNYTEDVSLLWSKDRTAFLGLGEKISALISDVVENVDPDKEIQKLQKYDIGYLTIYDKEYPEILKEIPDCPAVLYIKGNQKLLSKIGVAVVGSRKYSAYGKSVCKKIVRDLASQDLVIISGLALGIDAIAHESALDVDGETIGVLGCGLDQIYPVSNFQLAKEIINKNGTIISEYPLGTPPMKQNFPARNRIIAGLSSGVLVVEATVDSGSLITAMSALDYNREVFAIPGNIDSENSTGTNKLIQQGAKLVTEASDILSELNIESRVNAEKATKLLPETEEERKILERLSDGEKMIDELVKLTNLSIITINTTLTFLEMKGMVENIGGGRWKLIN